MKQEGVFICPYCNMEFTFLPSLCKHVYKEHPGIDQEQLIIDLMYDGIRPVCKCGCGEFTKLTFAGGAHFREYIHGHQSRVNNNWGNNPKALEHSIDTRRKRFASGELVQHSKGKKWEEIYSEESCERMMAAIKSKERGEAIRKALSGIPKSSEHIQHLKDAYTEDKREIQRQYMRKRLESGEFHISSVVETKFIETVIEPLNLKYETQKYIKDIHQYSDIYFPDYKLYVEFDGDYWHYNKDSKCGKIPPTEYQLEKIERDRIKDKYIEENGEFILHIWESDFKNDVNTVITSVKNKIEECIRIQNIQTEQYQNQLKSIANVVH